MLQLHDSLLLCLWQPGAGAIFPSSKEWAGFLKISKAPLLLSAFIEVVCTGVIEIQLNTTNDLV